MSGSVPGADETETFYAQLQQSSPSPAGQVQSLQPQEFSEDLVTLRQLAQQVDLDALNVNSPALATSLGCECYRFAGRRHPIVHMPKLEAD